MVYSTEGRTNLVVLFAIIIVSVLDGINLHGWDPTQLRILEPGLRCALAWSFVGLPKGTSSTTAATSTLRLA